MNDLRVNQRTPEEQDRHDRLSRVVCESDYEEDDEEEVEEQTEAKQVTEHVVTHEEKQAELMSKKWRRTTQAAMEFRVFLKREASEEIGKNTCDIMRNIVLPMAKESGWLEEIDAEGLKLTEKEEIMANNSWVNNERGEFSEETLTVASTIRLFNRTQKATDAVHKQQKAKVLNSMTIDEEPKTSETHKVKHLNVFHTTSLVWFLIQELNRAPQFLI